MRRWVAILSIICLLGLAGCGDAETTDCGRTAADYIGGGVLSVDIIHTVAGATTQWTAEGEAVNDLRTWATGLQYESAEFEEGQTPGDREGDEAYTFVLTEDGSPVFSYVINGKDNGYLLIEDRWYSVSNPSDPPVSGAAESGIGPIENPRTTSSLPLDGPPQLVVSTVYDVDSVVASCGNFEWNVRAEDGTGVNITACGAHPLDNMGERAILYTAFPAGVLPLSAEGENMSTIVPTFFLDFGEILPDAVTVQRWPAAYIGKASEFNGNSEEVMVSNLNGYAIIPFGDGEFVYSVHAVWDGVGRADYVFDTLPQVREQA